MFKKFYYIFAIAMLLTAVSDTGFSQEKTGETHTGVKRTYNKGKHKVKHAWNKTKATTAKEYHKVKTRVTTDDTKRDQQEHSK